MINFGMILEFFSISCQPLMTLLIFCVIKFSFLNVFGKKINMLLAMKIAEKANRSGRFKILLLMNKIPEIVSANTDAVMKMIK